MTEQEIILELTLQTKAATEEREKARKLGKEVKSLSHELSSLEEKIKKLSSTLDDMERLNKSLETNQLMIDKSSRELATNVKTKEQEIASKVENITKLTEATEANLKEFNNIIARNSTDIKAATKQADNKLDMLANREAITFNLFYKRKKEILDSIEEKRGEHIKHIQNRFDEIIEILDRKKVELDSQEAKKGLRLRDTKNNKTHVLFMDDGLLHISEVK
jgi:DNA repair exonuclease SbcCD ATPase subunit